MEYKLGERYVIKNSHSLYNGKIGTLVHAGNNNLLWLDIDETADTHMQRIVLFDFTTALIPADVYDEIRNLSKRDLITFVENIRRTGDTPQNVLDCMRKKEAS